MEKNLWIYGQIYIYICFVSEVDRLRYIRHNAFFPFALLKPLKLFYEVDDFNVSC